MQCQLACTLLDWPAVEWFQNEIGGYSNLGEIPDYRTIYGRLIWRTKVSSMADRIDRVTEDMVGLGPDTEEQPCSLRIWHGIDHLISFAATGTVDPTDETKPSVRQRTGRQSSPGVIERIRVFDAKAYRPVVNAIQTAAFTFASESYALLMKDRSATTLVNSQETAKAPQLAEPQVASSLTTVHIGTVIDSPLQFGSGSQSVEYSVADRGELTALMAKLTESLPEISLSQDNQEEAVAEISTIQAQLKSSRPKSGIIKDSLQTLKNVVESAAGSALAMGLAGQIAAFL